MRLICSGHLSEIERLTAECDELRVKLSGLVEAEREWQEANRAADVARDASAAGYNTEYPPEMSYTERDEKWNAALDREQAAWRRYREALADAASAADTRGVR